MKKLKPGLYTPLGLDGYQLCHPINTDDFEKIITEINGTLQRSSWRPIPMRLIHKDEGKTLIASDSPWAADIVGSSSMKTAMTCPFNMCIIVFPRAMTCI